MLQVKITRHAEFNGGEYHARVPGIDRIGRLAWVEREGKRVVEHTIVPPEISGRGVGGKLVAALMADAREQGFKVVPQCSFVAAAMADHPEWTDLRG